MGLGKFVVFDDDEVGDQPKKKSVKNKPQVKPKADPIPKTKPKTKKVVKPEPIEVKEKPVYATEAEVASTMRTLDERFDKVKKLNKDTYVNSYKGKKTLLGSLIKQTDKVIHVLLVNGNNARGAKFVSVSPRYITEREIGMVSKSYVSLDHSRRVLAVVEAKYMNGINYQKHRQKIVDQFL